MARQISRVIMAEQPNGPTTGTPDTGITAAYKVPLSAISTFSAEQEGLPVPMFTGDRSVDESVAGMINATGANPVNMDFTFVGRVLTWLSGRGSDYARPGGGSTSLHRWTKGAGSVTLPPYVQIEQQFNEATAQYIRHRSVRVDKLPFTQNLKGAVTYQLQCAGVGDYVKNSSLIPSPVASLTDDGPFFVPNYFNGFCFINNLACHPTAFNVTLDNKISRSDVGFNAGLADEMLVGKFDAQGSVTLNMNADGSAPESNFNFLGWAEAQTVIPLEWWIFDAPTTGAWTKFFRIREAVRFFLKTPVAGGMEARSTQQKFMPSNTGAWAAEIIAPAPGPYTLPAACHLGVKPNGGATVDVTLGITGSQTAAAIATALNADTNFNAVLVADAIAGALRIKSKSVLASSAVQIDGTVTNSAHTAIGFNTVAQLGYQQTGVIIDLLNAKGTDY